MSGVGQVARRIYRDLVRRRSSIRIEPAVETDGADVDPIFIIGVYRSGTTLLRYMVDSHSQICCPPESDFVLPFSDIYGDDRSLESLSNMGFDEEHVILRMRAFIDYFFSNYARTVGKPRWADKTPSYVDCLAVLHRIYPSAKFLFIYRDGLDQAHSMTRGGTFSRSVFQDHCEANEDLRVGATRYWAQQVRKMLEFEAAGHADVLRLRYEDLCQDPEAEMRRVFAFVDEHFEPEVLNYGAFSHTTGKEDGSAMSQAGVTPAVSHRSKWDPKLVDQCRHVAKAELAALGYTVTEKASEHG